MIRHLRNSCPSLNYFTNEQLVNLSKGLYQFRATQVDRNETFQMLRMVAPTGIDDGIISTSIREVIQKNSTEQDDNNLKDDQLDDLKNMKIYKTLTDMLPEKVVLAGIIEHDCDESLEESIAAWCYDNEHDPNKCYKIIEDFLNMDDELDEDDDSGVEDEESEYRRFSSRLENVWLEFRDDFISFKDSSKQVFVSFKILARLLDKLLEKSSTDFNRKLPKTLLKGQPNLVICPKDDIHATCLDLYLSDSSLLPVLEEVLICTPDTSLEQVDLILRRAFVDEKKKLFTIMHPEHLEYSIIVHMETLLEEHTTKDSTYQLVFLSTEGGSQSFGMYLEQFRRSLAIVESNERLAGLKTNLFQGLTRSQGASQADINKMKSRVVFSEQAGNGKSLVVDQLADKVTSTAVKISAQIYSVKLKYDIVIDQLYKRTTAIKQKANLNRFYHFDLVTEATKDTDDLLFQLVILGGMVDPKSGRMWIPDQQKDYIIVEMTAPKPKPSLQRSRSVNNALSLRFLCLLPTVKCLSPQNYIDLETRSKNLQADPSSPKDWIMGMDSAFETAQLMRPSTILQKVSLS